jgi:hypothetical protein
MGSNTSTTNSIMIQLEKDMGVGIYSTLYMKVDPDELFSEIASSYIRDGHGPPSGVNMKWKNVEIKGDDTPNSLGIKSRDRIVVRW